MQLDVWSCPHELAGTNFGRLHLLSKNTIHPETNDLVGVLKLLRDTSFDMNVVVWTERRPFVLFGIRTVIKRNLQILKMNSHILSRTVTFQKFINWKVVELVCALGLFSTTMQVCSWRQLISILQQGYIAEKLNLGQYLLLC